MGGISAYVEDQLLDALLGGGSYSGPGTVYVGLWTTTLSDASTGSTAGEVSAPEYARVSVTNNATNWPAASSGVKDNAVQFIFPTAISTWGTVRTVAVLDAATAGNILFYATPSPVLSVTIGDTLAFAPGDLSLRLD